MKRIATTEAVGAVICHDITRNVRGVVKDAAFRKGHVVTQDDIPILLSLGKDHLYVWEEEDGMIHEDEAAEILCSLCRNGHMSASRVKEGKIELYADCAGLFRVDVQRLGELNALGSLTIATRHTNTAVQQGDKLAGMRITPLVISEDKMQAVRQTAGEKPLLELLPFRIKTAFIVTTGNEVFYGRIEDTFTPYLTQKLSEYGISVTGHQTVNDDPEKIKAAILEAKAQGAQLILCTGGMSVDPDDCTPGAIRASGARIVSYGVPVLPGAMFLLGYFEDGTPVMGLPGGILYVNASVFDLILPRVAAGVEVTAADLAKMGHGGLCLGCPSCTYPCCPFGKGT